jgi:hypothetical protein
MTFYNFIGNMNQVEVAFLKQIASTTGPDRVKRCASLYASINQMLTLQSKKDVLGNLYSTTL